MTKIDTSQNQVPIWLVWSLATSGNKLLNAICLERERANYYRKGLSNESRYVKVWVEPCEANHLYAGLFEIPSDESIRSLVSQLAAAQHRVEPNADHASKTGTTRKPSTRKADASRKTRVGSR